MKLSLLILLVLVAVSILALGGSQAYAQQYPQVADLQPFTPAADYMSLPGYLRWQVFVEQGTWISRAEAVEIVMSQQKGAMPATEQPAPSEEPAPPATE